jgi:hypothetical protein
VGQAEGGLLRTGEATAILMRRTKTVTRAPIFESFRRMLAQVAYARPVLARAIRRKPVNRT